LDDVTTDFNNRKGQVEEAKGILVIRAEELVKQQGVYNSHQATYQQKETDLKIAKDRYSQVTQDHTQKTSEYQTASLKLKNIVSEKADLKLKTDSQKQEHDELEKKALNLEDDLAVVTGAKRALALTYNETLGHVQEVHDKLVKVQNDITTRNQDLATATSDQTKLFRELTELKARYASLSQSEHDHEAHAAQLAEKEAKEKQELEKLKAEEEKERAEIDALKVVLTELREKVETASKFVVSHREEVDQKVGLVKVARDTHETKHGKLIDTKQAHSKLKTTHLDAESKHQALQKKITQLELKLSALNKDDANTEVKLAALAALEAEERATIEKSKQSIVEMEGQVAAAKAELQDLFLQITVEDKRIIEHKETHKAVIAQYKEKIVGVTAEVSKKHGLLGQLQALVDHGKAKIKEVKHALIAKKSPGHHHHVAVIEYSTSSGDE